MSDDLVKQVKDLEGMDLQTLQERYQEVYGVLPISKNPSALRKMLAQRLNRMDIDARKKERAKGGKAATDAPATAPVPTITDRLAALSGMSLGALREEFERVFGQPSLSRNRKHLIKRIAEKVQADAVATLPTIAIPQPTLTVPLVTKGGKRKAAAQTKAAPTKDKSDKAPPSKRTPAVRDPRLPKPGTVIEREYHGKKLLVTVREDGFEFQGKPYRSLSALAKHISGSIVNGFVWWGLGLPEQRRKKSK